jgi:hypothetical protein
MFFFSPVTALLRALLGKLFSGTALTMLVLGIVGIFVAIIVVWGAVIVLIWNAVMAPYLGATQIQTLGGAVLFLVGVWFLGKLAGCLLGCWSIFLLVTGSAAVAILDMHLDPTHLLVFAVFLYIFGMGSSSSSSSSSSSRYSR